MAEEQSKARHVAETDPRRVEKTGTEEVEKRRTKAEKERGAGVPYAAGRNRHSLWGRQPASGHMPGSQCQRHSQAKTGKPVRVRLLCRQSQGAKLP